MISLSLICALDYLLVESWTFKHCSDDSIGKDSGRWVWYNLMIFDLTEFNMIPLHSLWSQSLWTIWQVNNMLDGPWTWTMNTFLFIFLSIYIFTFFVIYWIQNTLAILKMFKFFLSSPVNVSHPAYAFFLHIEKSRGHTILKPNWIPS